MTERKSSWPFGNFHCTYAGGLLYPWALVSHQPFLWRRPAPFIYSNWPTAVKTPRVLHTLVKGCDDQLWLISWRARMRDSDYRETVIWFTTDSRFMITAPVISWVNTQSQLQKASLLDANNTILLLKNTVFKDLNIRNVPLAFKSWRTVLKKDLTVLYL